MAGKTFEINLRIGAILANQFKSTFASADTRLNQLGAKITKLESSQGSIDRFRKLKRSIATTEAQLEEARKEANRLARDLKKNSRDKSLQRSFTQASRKARNLKTELNKQRVSLKRTREEMQRSGLSVHNLFEQHNKLSRAINKTHAAQTRLNRSMKFSQKAKGVRDKARTGLFASSIALGAASFPIRTSSSFGEAMAEVRAISGATEKQFIAMNDIAKRLGATTSFTATESAQALTELTRAGLSVERAIATLPNVLSLAKATSMELARSSTIVTDTMNAFEIQATDTQRIVDVLTKTANSSSTTLEEIGTTMSFVAPAAKTAGISLEETSAMIGLLANVGIKGSMAGTQLRQAINRLGKPTGEAAVLLRNLGIEVQDDMGNFRKFIDIFGDFSVAMEGLGSAERIAALGTIFDVRAATGIGKLIEKEGAGAVSKFVEVIKNSQDEAAKTAKIMDKELSGSFKRFASAFESIQLAIFNEKFRAVFSRIVDGVARFMGSVSTMLSRFPRLSAALGGLVLALIALSTAFFAVVFASSFIAPVLAKLNFTAAIGMVKALGAGLMFIAKAAIPLLLVGLKALWTAIISIPVIGWIIGILTLITVLVIKYWDPIKQFFINLWDAVGTALGFYWRTLKIFFGWIAGKFSWLINMAGKLGSLFGFGGEDSTTSSKSGNPLKQALPGTNNQTKNNITVSPNITIGANADKAAVQSAVNASMQESEGRLASLFDERLRDHARTSFA